MAPRSSWFAIIRSNQRRRIVARSLAVLPRHAGRDALAASIARLVSAVPILGTCPITAPVEGFIDRNGAAVIGGHPLARHQTGVAQQGRIFESEFRNHREYSPV